VFSFFAKHSVYHTKRSKQQRADQSLFFEERQINLIPSLSLIDRHSLPSTEQPHTLLGVSSVKMDNLCEIYHTKKE